MVVGEAVPVVVVVQVVVAVFRAARLHVASLL
jgi:hypothetical protein